jgi:hypothetical protein
MACPGGSGATSRPKYRTRQINHRALPAYIERGTSVEVLSVDVDQGA